MPNVTQKLLEEHRVDGEVRTGSELSIRIDQTLTQDATGTLVMLALDALGADRVRTEVSVQYVDHNLIQADNRNADDHLFLLSACRRFGVWFSGPGNGVSHPVHQTLFGRPGKSLLGSDSHTCAAGSLGMLAIGAGGLDVAMAMVGEPLSLTVPEIWGVRLVGRLPDWVSAKDVILELLKRHGVRGGVGRILEYSGPGLDCLTTMDRHVIANMGAELGATTSVFPSDDETKRFLSSYGRAADFRPLQADAGAAYDIEEELDLGALVPLIARPSSPGNVVPVESVEGEPIYQAYVGSSANPGFADFAVAADIVDEARVADGVSFDVNPTSRGQLVDLSTTGALAALVRAGARIHQAGCNGCIGMGQAPASGRNSLRTTPRNFPGRSGTKEDSVWLCSPETATASALKGRVTDPRHLGKSYPGRRVQERPAIDRRMLVEPPAERGTTLDFGPNIRPIPAMDAMPDDLRAVVLLDVGDDVSTDEILPAGARVLPYRSNLPKIAEFCFEAIDPDYAARARDLGAPHAILSGSNYGQGSSREHAALAPRQLGLRLVIARSIARIHRNNLVNAGVLPLFAEVPPAADVGDVLVLRNIRAAVRQQKLDVEIEGKGRARVRHDLSPREQEIVLAGGLINHYRAHAAA